ncbi:MAG: hypothetical protein QM796_17050 [Chthoniobacteraceae bacterium]
MKLQQLKSLAVLGILVFATVRGHALTVSVAPGGDIQSAINSVSAAGGGTVNVTSGTATISTALVMASNVTLNGAGNPTTTLNLSSSIANGITISGSTWSNINVQNIKIWGAGTTIAQNGVDLGSSTVGSGGGMTNVQSANLGYDGGKICGSNESVTSCNFHDAGLNYYYHGFYFLGGSGTVFSGNQFNHSPYGSGLHVNNWVTISGGTSKSNTSSNNGQEGHSFTANTSNTYNNYTISNCTANSNGFAYTSGTYYGFYLGSGSGTITGCTATGNNGAGYYYGGFSGSNNN